jgi:hypothetical protein
MTGPTPMLDFTGFSSHSVKYRYPFPVPTFENNSGIGPRMVMHIIWVTFEKLVQKNVKRKLFAISEKQIIAFKIWFIFYSVHYNAFASQTV